MLEMLKKKNSKLCFFYSVIFQEAANTMSTQSDLSDSNDDDDDDEKMILTIAADDQDGNDSTQHWGHIGTRLSFGQF